MTTGSREVIVASGGVRTAVLRELLGRTAGGVASVRLHDLASLAQRIVNDAGDYPRLANDGERRLAMRTAVRGVNDPLLESRGVASMLERSYRDVRDSGLPLDEFESRMRSRPVRSRNRTSLVLRVWREYERLIASLGCIDPADLLARAAARIPADLPPQIVAGFYDMTGAQLRLIEAIRDAGRLEAVFIPVTDDEAYAYAAPFIERLGTTHPPDPSLTLGMTNAAYSIEAHRTRLDEVESVCASIAELLANGTSPNAIGIVVRSLDPHDTDILGRFAAAHGFALTTSSEVPLRAHRMGRAIATLLRLRERGFPRHDVFELLRDGVRLQRTIEVDRTDLVTRRARIAAGASAELRPLSKKPLVEDYIAVVAELEALTTPLAAPMTGNEWGTFLTKVAALFVVETDDDANAADAIEEIATLFRNAAIWNTRFDPTAVEDAIAQKSLPQPRNSATQQPLFFGDVMRMRGRTFDHLFAVRMQDDVFPQRRVDDPLLPDADRRLLGVREIGDGRDEERLLFQLLLDSAATTIRFTFAGSDGFGKALRPSQLLKGFAIAREPERKVALLKDFGREVARSRSDEEVPTPRPRVPASRRQLQLLVSSGTRSPFDGHLSAAPNLRRHFERILLSVTPTQLEDFGECPQKFFFKHVLGAEDIDHPERELQMQPREKGSLDHDILERFYRERFGQAGAPLPPLSLERLHEIIDQEFDKIEAVSPPFNRTWREIERRATKRTLGQFVTADLAELQTLGLEPRWFEYSFGKKYADRGKADHSESFVIDAHGISLRVEGKIDRIDEGGGLLRIVDYKSGKALRHKDLDKKIDRGVRLQLALYAMAVASFFDRDAGSVLGTIKPLVLGGPKPEKYAFSLAEKAPRLVETLDLFARSILDGFFPAFPDDDDDDVNACKYCPVRHSCRTRHDPVEKYAVRRWKEPRTLLEQPRAPLEQPRAPLEPAR